MASTPKSRAKYLYQRYGVKTPSRPARSSKRRRTVHVRGYCRSRAKLPSWLRGNDTPF